MVERTILPGIGDSLLKVESVISVERLDISRSSVVRSSLRIPIRSKGKVTVGVIEEIHLARMKEVEKQTQIMLTVILNQDKTENPTVFSVGDRLGKRSGIALQMSLLTQEQHATF